MKRKILFCTRAFYYWILLPLILFFVLCILYHDKAEGVLKLYPLEVILACGILFVLVYFTRLVIFTKGKVRDFGYFTERDSTAVNRGKTLIFTLLSRHRVKIEVFGTDGKPAALDWTKDGEPTEITLYRARALGGKKTLASLLSFYGVEETVCAALFDAAEDFSEETSAYRLTKTVENDTPVVRFTLKETLLEEKTDEQIREEKNALREEREKSDGYHFRLRDRK